MKILRDEGSKAVLYDTSTLKFDIIDSHPWPSHDRCLCGRKREHNSEIPTAPVRIYWEVTRRCNLTCKHCFTSSSPTMSYGLATVQLLTLMERMKELNVIDLRFTGGEATTRTDWFELLRTAKDMQFVVSLNTNGVYDNPSKVIHQMASLNLEQVTVSLDGLRDSHDSIRGIGSFELAIAALREMHNMGIRTRVNCVLTRKNVDESKRLLELLHTLVEEINFFSMRPVGRGRGLITEMIDFGTYQESAVCVLSQKNNLSNVRLMHREQALSEQGVHCWNDETKTRSIIRLPAGVTNMSVSSDGRYWPHGFNIYQDDRLSFGQFPDNDLENAWLNSKEINRFRNWEDALLSRCRKCNLFGKMCPGSNVEMEIAVQLGVLDRNPYCENVVPAPILFPK